jgi:hypothetical protein
MPNMRAALPPRIADFSSSVRLFGGTDMIDRMLLPGDGMALPSMI